MKARFAVALCLVGCSSQNAVSDGGVDAATDATIADGGGDAQPTDAGTDSSLSCSGLVIDAGAIAPVFVATPPPVGTGGTIVDGVYDITAWSVYTGADGGTGPTGEMTAGAMVIQAGAYRYRHDVRQGDAGAVVDTNGTFTTPDGGALVGQQNCPTQGPQPFTSYSTDGGVLVMYSSNPPWGLALKKR